MKHPIIISAGIALVIIGGAFVLTYSGGRGGGVARVGQAPGASVVEANNVSVVDGTQIVEIRVKGGYMPETSVAKAGMPTVLRLKTNGTFDCSSSVQIPGTDIRKNLPPTGDTDIDLGIREAGTLEGTCSMGMYTFSVVFE